MNIGTKSILFGTHQFIIHPAMVARAWRIIYRQWPSIHEWCAIITHDLGYWGSRDIDGGNGEMHPVYAAKWWYRNFGYKFGRKVGLEILGHSRFYAGKNGMPLSRLFQADKLSMALYPKWLYLLLGNLSGEIKEYMSHTRICDDKYIDMLRGDKCRGQMQWLLEAQAHMTLMGLHGSDYGPVAKQMRVDALKIKHANVG